MIRTRIIAALAAGVMLAACATTPTVAPPAAPQSQALLPADPAGFFDCLRQNKLAVIGAHRMGYGGDWPENSRTTGAHMLSQTPALLETDVRQTKDGALVIMHDDDLARTSTGAGKTILQLDIKRGVSFPAVVASVRAADAEARVIVIVYSNADAIQVAKLNPKLMLSVSINEVSDLDELRAGGVDLTRVLAFTGTRAPDLALYAALSKAGVEVIFGTLGRKGESLDDRYAKEGEAGYAKLMEGGVQVIATNRGGPAATAIDAADGPGFAPAKCLTAKGPAQ
jgi:glycerophosphoryl diester phosphodiesterase